MNTPTIDELLGIQTAEPARAATGQADATVDALLGIAQPIEKQMPNLPHLAEDLRHQAHGITRTHRDARQVQTAATALDHIPAAHEAAHLVIAGRFALADFIPAALVLASPATVAGLHIATLGFSRANILDLAAMLDAGQIGKASLLCSHYFRGTSREIYDLAAGELGRRPQARFLSLRTHAKLLAMMLTDGRTLTIESSANLRSCKNIETATAIGDPAVYAFHVAWIDSLFAAATTPPQEAQA